MVSYTKLIKLVLPVFIFGCSSKSEKGDLVLEEMIKSLETSNSSINNSSAATYWSIENKLADPITVEKAQIWEPKAKKINKLSKDVYSYIENLKAGLKEKTITELSKDKKGEELFKKLTEYKRTVLNIDPKIYSAFENSISITTSEFDSGKIKDDFTDYFFNNTSTLEALALLTRFQNNIKVIENRVISFCDNQMIVIVHRFETYSPLVSQDKSQYMPGETIEIMAGIGAFSKAALPKIFIQGEEVELNESGYATMNIKIGNKPGFYSIPVKISYTDQDGKKNELVKTVKYRVSDCKN